MTNILPKSSINHEQEEKKSEEKSFNNEKLKKESTELDAAVFQAERAILEKMASFEELKTATEEEVELQVIRDEADPVVKTEDRLTTAVHLKLLPEFIQYYLTSNKKRVKPAVLKQVFRLLFGSFMASGKNSLAIVLPVLEIVEEKQRITPEIVKKIDQELEEKILSWLRQELKQLYGSPAKTITILKQILEDIERSNQINDMDDLLNEALSCF